MLTPFNFSLCEPTTKHWHQIVTDPADLIDIAVPICWPSALSPTDCDEIRAQFDRVPLTKGDTIGDYERGRDSSVHILKLSDMSEQSRACLDVVAQKCRAVFAFDIDAIEPFVQYSRYTVNNYFNWHVDSGMGVNRRRKLSISIQLSGAKDYAGGNLQFYPGYQPAYSRNKGAVIAFAPFVLHRVTPIEHGVRESLVMWLSGPPFR